MNKEYLWEKLGADIQQGLLSPTVYEVTLNPKGDLWFTEKSKGNVYFGDVNARLANGFVHAFAQYSGKFLNSKKPYLDAILPFNGERINITIPPITSQVSFNIRKKSTVLFTLNDYVKSQILTSVQADYLVDAVTRRKNILISGSPAAGKTTFANALCDVISKTVPTGHRILLLEQVPELQCSVKNAKRFLVSEHVSMNTLLWLCMRNSADRIIVGEVRDGAALEMLKAWNTGCQGGIATIHANSAQAAVQRVLDLACEATLTPPLSLAAEALDVIVQIEEDINHPAKRVVSEIVELTRFNQKTRQFVFKPFNKEGL